MTMNRMPQLISTLLPDDARQKLIAASKAWPGKVDAIEEAIAYAKKKYPQHYRVDVLVESGR
jgi:hypothetical protein